MNNRYSDLKKRIIHLYKVGYMKKAGLPIWEKIFTLYDIDPITHEYSSFHRVQMITNIDVINLAYFDQTLDFLEEKNKRSLKEALMKDKKGQE